MKTCPLLISACLLLSPGTGLFCAVPKPLTTPFTAIFPKGPASKTAGGLFASGPDKEGAESGIGPAGAAGAAGAAAEAGAGAAVVAEASCPKPDVAINAAVKSTQTHVERIYIQRPPEIFDYKAD